MSALSCTKIVDEVTQRQYYLLVDYKENKEDIEGSWFVLQATDGRNVWQNASTCLRLGTAHRAELSHALADAAALCRPLASCRLSQATKQRTDMTRRSCVAKSRRCESRGVGDLGVDPLCTRGAYRRAQGSTPTGSRSR